MNKLLALSVIAGLATILIISTTDQVLGVNGSGAQDKRTGIGGFCIFYEDRTECRFHDGDGISTVIVDGDLQDIGDRSVCHPVTDRIVIEKFPDESELVIIVVDDCSGDETTFNLEKSPIFVSFGYLKIAG
jgi:hypothetical protein